MTASASSPPSAAPFSLSSDARWERHAASQAGLGVTPASAARRDADGIGGMVFAGKMSKPETRQSQRIDQERHLCVIRNLRSDSETQKSTCTK